MTKGYKTTEFWLSLLVVLLGALLSSGALADGSLPAQIVGGALSILAALGYTAARAKTKVGTAQAEALRDGIGTSPGGEGPP